MVGDGADRSQKDLAWNSRQESGRARGRRNGGMSQATVFRRRSGGTCSLETTNRRMLPAARGPKPGHHFSVSLFHLESEAKRPRRRLRLLLYIMGQPQANKAKYGVHVSTLPTMSPSLFMLSREVQKLRRCLFPQRHAHRTAHQGYVGHICLSTRPVYSLSAKATRPKSRSHLTRTRQPICIYLRSMFPAELWRYVLTCHTHTSTHTPMS